MKLGTKLIIAFLLMGLFPLSIATLISLDKADKALSRQAFNQLEAVRDIKKNQLEQLFTNQKNDLNVLMKMVTALRSAAFDKLISVQALKTKMVEDYFITLEDQLKTMKDDPMILEAMINLNQAFEDSGDRVDTRLWMKTAEAYHARFKDIVSDFGWRDLLLIHTDGDIVYTVAQEKDLGEVIPEGELKESSLGRLFQRAKGIGSEDVAIADFEPYGPSNGEQAAFMMAQLRDEESTLQGYLAFQLSTDQINSIMQQRAGMGRSGESYLIGKCGGKVAFRSDLKTMGDGNYVIGYEISNLEYIEKALNGKKEHNVYTDSSGNLVMVAFNPVSIHGLQWACISKINLEEAIVPWVEGSDKNFYQQYIEAYGYYDLFLIHPEGRIFFTGIHEPDYGTNIIDGVYSDSGLGRVTRQVLESKVFGAADMSPYAPSNGDPAAFIAQPFLIDGDVELVVALQLPLDKINFVMGQRAGMGDSGETYLVGPDQLMRSDSFLDPENHSVRNAFAKPDVGNVDTVATRRALQGQSDEEIIEDYNGNPVLSAFTPLTFFDVTWALIAEIDAAEAFSAVTALKWAALIVAAVAGLGILVLAFLFTRSIVHPVKKVVSGLKELAQGEGDLTLRLPVTSKDEIGELAVRFNEFLEKLQQMIKDISGGVEMLSSSSTELAAISQQMADGAGQTSEMAHTVATASEEMTVNMASVSAAMEETSTNSSMVATAAEEMNATINEITENTHQARAISENAAKKVTLSTEQMDELGNAAQEIGKVIETITDISAQVNLLSLNATIEAARAGEAGKGFAVVASEIKALATQTADAALDIHERISKIQKSTGDTTKVIKEINQVIHSVNEIVGTIATAVEEQSSATTEISENIAQVSSGIQEVNHNVGQSASVAEEISRDITQVNQSSDEMSNSSEQVKISAGELSALAEQLRNMVGRFKI